MIDSLRDANVNQLEIIIVGSVKMSWLDIRAEFDDYRTIPSILGDSSFLGIFILRPFDRQVGGWDEIHTGHGGVDIRRNMSLVRMQSWGEGLSACRNVLGLLKAVYDGVLSTLYLLTDVVLYAHAALSSLAALPTEHLTS